MIIKSTSTAIYRNNVKLNNNLQIFFITCIKTRATVWPAGTRGPICFGRRVAKMTMIAVTPGRVPPWIPVSFVKYVAALHIIKDVATAVAVCNTGRFPWESDSICFASSVKNQLLQILYKKIRKLIKFWLSRM